MQEAIKANPGEDLRIYVVWIDILQSDDKYSAYLRSTEFDDPRVTYHWDRYKLTGAEWQEVVDINNVAWDIYFLYGPESQWGDLPTYPNFFMNQIGLPQEISPRLDGNVLSEKINAMLTEIR
jgi:hypothetical protein